MSFLPPELEPYSAVISVILLFVDGVILGVAVKKALLSTVLFVIGLLLAGFVGLSLPFMGANDIMTHLTNIFISQARHFGVGLSAFPVFWIIGFAIGVWKG